MVWRGHHIAHNDLAKVSTAARQLVEKAAQRTKGPGIRLRRQSNSGIVKTVKNIKSADPLVARGKVLSAKKIDEEKLAKELVFE